LKITKVCSAGNSRLEGRKEEKIFPKRFGRSSLFIFYPTFPQIGINSWDWYEMILKARDVLLAGLLILLTDFEHSNFFLT
jgi:hypothetical protein